MSTVKSVPEVTHGLAAEPTPIDFIPLTDRRGKPWNIVNAVEARDAQRAGQPVATHIRHTILMILRILSIEENGDQVPRLILSETSGVWV